MQAEQLLPETDGEVRGGSLNVPALTDSMGNRVCGHQSVSCDVLWKISKELVPTVPLFKRTWINEKLNGESVLEATLTRDQRFNPRAEDPKGLGIRLGIESVEAVDLVNGFWKGKVSIDVCVLAGVLACNLGGVNSDAKAALLAVANGDQSDEMRQRALEQLNRNVELYRAGEVKRHEFDRIEGMSEAEGLMRFLQFGVLNWYRNDDDHVYPYFSGDSFFRWENKEGSRLAASFTVTSLWKNTPDLHMFPFDINGLCAIFWSKAFTLQVCKGRAMGLGASFQEFDMFDFRGETMPFSGNIWDVYYPESNVVPNAARGGESIFYVRFWVRRKATYHVVSVLIPSVIVGLLGVPALMIADGTSPNSIINGSESPLSFVSGLLLTLMAMKFAFVDSLPKLGYLTMLDWHLAISFLLLAAVAALMVTVHEDVLSEWNVTAIYFGVYVFFNVIFFGRAWLSYRIPVEKVPSLTFPQRAE